MTDTRGRQDRQTEVAAERRRRSDDTLDGNQSLKLAIPLEIQRKLEAQGRTPRWINDVGSRVHDLTVNDDWDRVEGVEPREVIVDKANGKLVTAKAILVSKPTAFIAEDRAKKDAIRRANEKAMLTGTDPETGQSKLAPGQYAHAANKIGRENQLLE